MRGPQKGRSSECIYARPTERSKTSKLVMSATAAAAAAHKLDRRRRALTGVRLARPRVERRQMCEPCSVCLRLRLGLPSFAPRPAQRPQQRLRLWRGARVEQLRVQQRGTRLLQRGTRLLARRGRLRGESSEKLRAEFREGSGKVPRGEGLGRAPRRGASPRASVAPSRRRRTRGAPQRGSGSAAASQRTDLEGS